MGIKWNSMQPSKHLCHRINEGFFLVVGLEGVFHFLLCTFSNDSIFYFNIPIFETNTSFNKNHPSVPFKSYTVLY